MISKYRYDFVTKRKGLNPLIFIFLLLNSGEFGIITIR